MRKYLVIIEKCRKNYSAYCPDLPGCVATGATVRETRMIMREAIRAHLAGMAEDNTEPPSPRAVSAQFILA
jgi:predicted RNase H-like HicB family nuclease